MDTTIKALLIVVALLNTIRIIAAERRADRLERDIKKLKSWR